VPKNIQNIFKVKKLPILAGIILGIFVAIFIFGAVFNSLSGNSAIKVVSAQSVFQSSENPQFIFVYKKQANIFNRFFAIFSNLFSSESKKIEATATIFNKWGEEVDTIIPQIEYRSGGKISLILDHSHFQQELRPGKYKLEFEVKDGDKIYTQEQDFTWGVLAINTNKSIYLPGENAYLQFAVLKDDGHTICDAILKLEITTPKKQKIYPEVQESGKCAGDNVTDVPDYFANYSVDGPGKYQMKLTNLDNGYEIIDYFEVRKSVPFEIERTGPTRIFPPAQYEMKIKIKANSDFEGEIVETVPMTFAVEEKLGAKQEPFVENYTKVITWHVKIKKDQIYEIVYQFRAPNISPYFYYFGPLKIGDWQEAREWQIAADSDTGFHTYAANAAVTLANTAGDDNGFQGTSGNSPADATTSNDGYLYDQNSGDATASDGCGGDAQIEDDQHDFYQFDFDGLTGNTITGIQVLTEGFADSATGPNIFCILLSWDGGAASTSWTNSSGSTALAATDSTIYLGSADDLWKKTWTSASFNQANFRVRVMNDSTASNNRDYSLDLLQVKVFYDIVYTISGTCQLANQSDTCANGMTVKAAVNASLDSASGTTAGGSWTITLASSTPIKGDVITVFLDGADDPNEAVAVTKWGSTTTLSGVILYQNHLVIGNNNGAQTITNANLAQYDPTKSDEDVFYKATSTTGLTVCFFDGCESAELYIVAGNTYQPRFSGNFYVKAHDIEIDGTFDMTSGGVNNYASISGSWNNDGVFTVDNTSMIYFTATASTELVSESQGSTVAFNYVQFGSDATSSAHTAHWDLNGTSTPFDVNGNLIIADGTLHGLKNINLGGDLTINTNGDYLKDNYTFTFDGNIQTWTDNRTTKADMGTVVAAGTVWTGLDETNCDAIPGWYWYTTNSRSACWSKTLDSYVSWNLGVGNDTDNPGAYTCASGYNLPQRMQAATNQEWYKIVSNVNSRAITSDDNGDAGISYISALAIADCIDGTRDLCTGNGCTGATDWASCCSYYRTWAAATGNKSAIPYCDDDACTTGTGKNDYDAACDQYANADKPLNCASPETFYYNREKCSGLGGQAWIAACGETGGASWATQARVAGTSTCDTQNWITTSNFLPFRVVVRP